MWITIKIQQYRELKNLKYILSQKYAELQELADEQWKASQKIERRVNCNGVQCLMPPKKDLHGTYDHPCVVTHYAYTTGYAFSRTWSAVPEEEKSECRHYRKKAIVGHLLFGNEPCTDTNCRFHKENIAAADAFEKASIAAKNYDTAKQNYQNARHAFYGKYLSRIFC